MKHQNDPISRKLKVLEAVYSSVLNAADFDKLISAWDKAYLNDIFSERSEDVDMGLNLAEIDEHFSRALQLETIGAENDEITPEVIVAKELLPAFIWDTKGQVVARNDAFKILSGSKEIESLEELSEHFGWELAEKLKIVSKPKENEFTQVLVQSYAIDEKPYLFQISNLNQKSGNSRGAEIIVRVIETILSDQLSTLLSSTFNLTEAEIETVRFLVSGNSAVEIAEIRERSLDTVRNQIKSILSKTQAKGQLELVRTLTLLNQISANGESGVEKQEPYQNELRGSFSRNIADLDGRQLEYARYGKLGGPVVFYVTTSSLPEETLQFRNEIRNAGIEVIAPYRPGFSASEKASHNNSLVGFADDCVRLIDELELDNVHLVGHREGGIFASHIASLLGERARTLTIVNTGAPVKDWKKLHQSSLVARRSLATALKMPKALALGYRLAVRIFFSGQTGENKILNFFYSGSPLDLATYQEPHLREVTRRNIAYCFESSDDIVSDIALWASDWSEDVNDAALKMRVLFIHAAEHDFMLAEWVKEFCRDNGSMDYRIIPLSAQTMLYTHTRKVVRLISNQIISVR